MLLADADNIREVIAFPKTQSAIDLLMGAPSPVDDKQLREFHLQVHPEEKKLLNILKTYMKRAV